MLKNHFKTAYRNILRDGSYSVIRIIGLALGFGTSMVIFLYVMHQLSYDNFHPHVDRLYRVNQTNIWDPAGGRFSSTGPAVAIALADGYPEIEEVLRINTPGESTIRYVQPQGELIAINEENIFAADSNFFSFFGIRLKEGDSKTALKGNGKVILSDKAAIRLFGNESALGKIVQYGDNRQALEVTGITEQQPSNMHFNFDYLLSMPTTNVKQYEWSWIWTQVVTYVKVNPGTNVLALESKLKSAPDQYAPSTFKKLNMDYDEFVQERGKWELYLQPMTDIHLNSVRMGNRLGDTGDKESVIVFSIIGLFILLIAVVNFVNLSTARAVNRAKEVGVKKTLGWSRSSLIFQFQVEHILITVLSMLIGLAIMELLRIVIQPLAGISIPISLQQTSLFFVLIILFPVLIGFLAGLYPSFYLTSFKPAQVLKGKVTSGFRTSGLRNVLVVFQFIISIALMAATLIIFSQLRFFQSRSLGFNKDNLLLIRHAEKLGDQLESFRNEIQNLPGVLSVATSMDIRAGYEDIFMREGDEIKLPLSQYKVDEHFFSTTEIKLASGRSFEAGRVADKNVVLINETTARLFGWTSQEALGKKIIYVGDEVGPQEVIGVVKDFHFQSLRQNIAPAIFYHINSTMWGDQRILLIKYSDKEVSKLLDNIKQKWEGFASATPFHFSFYDEELKMQYAYEQRLGSMFTIFTALSIFIAVIGLVGLVAYSAEQRKKEIGVRKVFGASLLNVYVMMNSQYIKLIGVALLIATPITWLGMQQWLNNYSYKIDIDPWIFVWAGAGEIVFALCCVGYIAYRAATLNPAEVLKEG